MKTQNNNTIDMQTDKIYASDIEAGITTDFELCNKIAAAYNNQDKLINALKNARERFENAAWDVRDAGACIYSNYANEIDELLNTIQKETK